MNGKTIFIPLYLVCIVTPLFFFLGPVRLSPYRFFLLVSVVPAVTIWLTNKQYKKLLPDFLIIFFSAWATIALTVIYGPQRSIEAGGILAVETIGSYFTARVLVSCPERFDQLCKWLLIVILSMIPFALVEAATGRNLMLEFFRLIGPTPPAVNIGERLGLHRVQGPFDHPILFGVFCGMGVSIAFYYRFGVQNALFRYVRTLLVTGTAMLSLSSGPLTGISGQVLLIAFDTVSRSIVNRWKLVLAGVVGLWVLIDLLSTRSPPQVFITYFAFNQHSGYNRVFIWRYGTQSILNNPWFGIGFEEYQRPDYVFSSSVDMFWILPSMQFGIPSGFALLIAFAYIAIRVSRAQLFEKDVQIQRRAMMFCLVGIFLSGWTVHYWNATYSIVVFMFGASVWFFSTKDIAREETGNANKGISNRHQTIGNIKQGPARARKIGYTRPKRSRMPREREIQ